ncbi:ATP-binding protein [Paracoccus sp. (in: a-proteobacteria)]|uniref:sensor histidine kinase n=1 Tax=Paracoccus sp. TaxID=267 RepID=UPI003A876F11
MPGIRDLIDRHFLYRTSTRLSLTFILASVLVGLTTIYILSGILPEHPRNQLSQLLAQQVVRPLGVDPSPEAVNRLARELNIGLLVRDDKREMHGGGIEMSAEQVETLLAEKPGRTSYEASVNGEDVFVLRDHDRIYVFTDFVTGMSFMARAKLMGGPAVILLILILAFVVVRRTVAPVAPLTDAVREIGEGNLEKRVKPTGRGELRELEDRVNSMAVALRRAERVKRDMLIAIGHEFFSPIARLMFQAERIEDPALRSKITDNLLRINLLFRTLISVQALQDKAEDNSAPPLLFPDCIVEIATAAAEGRVEFDLPLQKRYLYIDRMRLELLLNNFISNALRYAPDSRIEISAFHGHDTLTLMVADRGCGVSEELIEDLGEPFLKEDKARGFSTGGGLGLGLYLCSRIVARADGKMQIWNREGGGLAVRVDWPCAAQVVS